MPHFVLSIGTAYGLRLINHNYVLVNREGRRVGTVDFCGREDYGFVYLDKEKRRLRLSQGEFPENPFCVMVPEDVVYRRGMHHIWIGLDEAFAHDRELTSENVDDFLIARIGRRLRRKNEKYIGTITDADEEFCDVRWLDGTDTILPEEYPLYDIEVSIEIAGRRGI